MNFSSYNLLQETPPFELLKYWSGVSIQKHVSLAHQPYFLFFFSFIFFILIILIFFSVRTLKKNYYNDLIQHINAKKHQVRWILIVLSIMFMTLIIEMCKYYFVPWIILLLWYFYKIYFSVGISSSSYYYIFFSFYLMI